MTKIVHHLDNNLNLSDFSLQENTINVHYIQPPEKDCSKVKRLRKIRLFSDDFL